jgi:hypothetical protein
MDRSAAMDGMCRRMTRTATRRNTRRIALTTRRGALVSAVSRHPRTTRARLHPRPGRRGARHFRAPQCSNLADSATYSRRESRLADPLTSSRREKPTRPEGEVHSRREKSRLADPLIHSRRGKSRFPDPKKYSRMPSFLGPRAVIHPREISSANWPPQRQC